MKRITLGLATAALFSFFAACSKQDDFTIVEEARIPEGQARVSFVNTVPGGALSGLRYNDSLVDSDVDFTDVLSYQNVKSGDLTVGMTGVDAAFSVNRSVPVNNGGHYSLYTYMNGNGMGLVQVEDSVQKFDENQIRVRFLHFSPDAGEVNFRSAEGTYNLPIAAERNFNDISTNRAAAPYVALRAGDHRFNLFNSRTGERIYRHRRTRLEPGHYYTVVAIGNAGATQSRTLQLLVLMDR